MHAPTKTSSPAKRELRRQRIAHFVRSQRVANQQQLLGLLAQEDLVVNQATLSRDIRDMGLLKGRDGYEFPAEVAVQGADESVALYHAVATWLAEAAVAENLLVLKTPPGGASPLALALDHDRWKGVLGTIAGDDTILVICKSGADARRALRQLLDLRERRRR